MTDIKLLALLNDYYTAQRNVASSMLWAMEYFERGRECDSWAWLFYWCEDKDRREELWGKFKHNYPRAMMLKEGYLPMTEIHSCSYYCDRSECIKAQRDELRERLAQPEQEPVGWFDADSNSVQWKDGLRNCDLADRQPFYTAQQPQMQPCAGRNCGSTNPKLHSAECFEDYEKSTGMAQPEQGPVAWEDVLGAIARGWTHDDNKHKPMDVQLAVAIAKEIQDMVIAPPQRKPLKLREIEKCIYDANNDPIVACRNVEAAHGIKEKA